MTSQRVLMVGMDAMELSVVQQLMDAGRLPALRGLRERGCFGEMGSFASLYAGGVWPTFYTGQDVPWHGVFHNKQWHPGAMRCEVPDERWPGPRPFWERLGALGCRLCIVDVPMVLGEVRPINGSYVAGWGTHDLITRGSWPAALWSELARRHGTPCMPPERFGPQNGRMLMRLRRDLLKTTDQVQAVAVDLLRRERWDFACVVLGAAHRLGHYLWDLSQIDPDLDADERRLLSGAVDESYAKADTALAEIIAAAGDDTVVIAFALHGMNRNAGWADLGAGIVESFMRHDSRREDTRGVLYALKKRLPVEWVRPVLDRLPLRLRDGLVPLWSAGMYDWKTTPFFPVPMDHAGYVRVNLRGRERDGVVEPDAYDDVCEQLTQAFLNLRTASTGEPIVRQVVRAYADAAQDAPGRSLLPDLIVPWTGPSAADAIGLTVSGNDFPRLAMPRRLPSGRSGNHTDSAWFMAAGPGIRKGTIASTAHILDLAPTVFHLLGVPPERSFQGRAISLDPQPAGNTSGMQSSAAT